MRFENIRDAQQNAMGFLIQQATLIEPAVYNLEYEDIQYQNLVPVDTSAPDWIQTVTYFSNDAVGQAQWFAGKAQDVPHVELTREKFTSNVNMAAIGHNYDLEELGTAQLHGIPLTTDKASMARRAAEEFIDAKVFVGDLTLKGYRGLVNATTPTATSAPADGTGSSRAFADKTPDQILRDVNVVLQGHHTDTYGKRMSNTLLFPHSVLNDLSVRRLNDLSQTTILQWLEENNIYTRLTRQRLDIRGLFSVLETAGTSSSKRMVSYHKAPDVLKMHVPMPFRFLPVYQTGPMLWEVPGIFRLGPLDIRLPKAVRYLDQI